MTVPHRVVITGIGLVTPVGNNTPSTWQALVNGQSGLSLVDHPALENYPYRFGGLVKNEQDLLDAILHKKNQAKTSRFIHLALMAGIEAMRDAGLTEQFPEQRERFGVYLGVGIGGLDSLSSVSTVFAQEGPKTVSPFSIPKTINNLAPSWLAMQCNAQGLLAAVTTACSSGGDAVGMAYRAIKHGYADYMLAGGTESCVIPLALVAFGNMRALSAWQGDPAQASRPFDRQRTGFVLAEGAGIVMLERYDKAVERGARIYAEVAGYGATSDAYHITAMHPEGRGAIAAISDALADARIDEASIGYVNAHGTGTLMNDAVETAVLKKVFGDHADAKKPDHLLVSSTKSMTGHMIGAAGGAEIGITALALHEQVVPPTINLDEPGEGCDLDYVAHEARSALLRYAMSNSFGFGGGNAVVVLKKV